jgi:hypothetical protein
MLLLMQGTPPVTALDDTGDAGGISIRSADEVNDCPHETQRHPTKVWRRQQMALMGRD